jgi:pimeloyl-ACP methyl ester carboxylesterase
MLDSARLAQGRAPALSIVSAHDPMLGPSRSVAQWWPGTRLVTLPRGDHADIFLAPELVAAFRRLAIGVEH